MAAIYRKFIVTHSSGDRIYSNAFLIPNNYNKSLGAYKRMFDHAKSIFPEIKEDDVECGVVIKSMWCKDMPIMRIPVQPGITVDGWTNTNHLPDIIF